MSQKSSCLSIVILLLFNAIIGAWSVNVILSWFGKSIPTIASFILGLFVGEVSIPIAVVGKILKACGVF